MATDEQVFIVCLHILRWLGLTFTKIQRSKREDFIAKDSKLHFILNAGFVCVFMFLFSEIHYKDVENKFSKTVYPLHVKFMILGIVAFSLCGNLHNRKFVSILNLFLKVTRELERDFGDLGHGRRGTGQRTFVLFILYVAIMTGFTLWTDAYLSGKCERLFRYVHHFTFCYVTLFTAYYIITMNYVKKKFKYANAAFRSIIPRTDVNGSSALIRKRLVIWLEGYMELRRVEELVNEVFGKQIFLTQIMSFCGIAVNSYYFIAFSLQERCIWLNITIWIGFFQAVIVALLSTRAAQSAANEANKINEMIFGFPVHLQNWNMHDRIKYFALFIHNYPVEFKAWVFYTISYDSLFKVVLTSGAITAVIAQCDFLRDKLKVSK